MFFFAYSAYAWEKNKHIHSARVRIVVSSKKNYVFFTFVVYTWKRTNNLLTCKEEKLRMELRMEEICPVPFNTERLLFF